VLAVALAPFLASAQEAMLMDLSGTVTVASGNQDKPAGILDYLQDGAELHLADQATATIILLAPSTQLHLAGPGSFRIRHDHIETIKGAPPASAALNTAVATQAHQFAPAVRERMAMAAIVTRDAGEPKAPQLQGPGSVTVLTSSPQFWWSSVGAGAVTVSVWDAGGTLVWQGTSAQPGARIGLALAPGDYEWAAAQGGLASGRAQFTVADAAAAKAFPPLASNAPFSDRLLRAIALENAGYGYDAWMLWKQLAGERPDNPVLAKMAQ
jgi:hypothetical protein